MAHFRNGDFLYGLGKRREHEVVKGIVVLHVLTDGDKLH